VEAGRTAARTQAAVAGYALPYVRVKALGERPPDFLELDDIVDAALARA